MSNNKTNKAEASQVEESTALSAAEEIAAVPTDARDHTIAELREELARIKATPEGAAAENAKALAALAAKVDAMASGKGLVPVASSDKPDPLLYGAVLATGEVVHVAHPNATHHYSEKHDTTIPIMSHFTLDDATRARVNA